MTPDLSLNKLSIVVPAFNEAEGIGAFLEQLFAVLCSCCSNFEVWVIDDGSGDATWARLRAEQLRYPQLHGLRFTRNFGKEAAILAGLRHARGDAVIVRTRMANILPPCCRICLNLGEAVAHKLSLKKIQAGSRWLAGTAQRLYLK